MGVQGPHPNSRRGPAALPARQVVTEDRPHPASTAMRQRTRPTRHAGPRWGRDKTVSNGQRRCAADNQNRRLTAPSRRHWPAWRIRHGRGQSCDVQVCAEQHLPAVTVGTALPEPRRHAEAVQHRCLCITRCAALSSSHGGTADDALGSSGRTDLEPARRPAISWHDPSAPPPQSTQPAGTVPSQGTRAPPHRVRTQGRDEPRSGVAHNPGSRSTGRRETLRGMGGPC
jgi:hypothetical protein